MLSTLFQLFVPALSRRQLMRNLAVYVCALRFIYTTGIIALSKCILVQKKFSMFKKALTFAIV